MSSLQRMPQVEAVGMRCEITSTAQGLEHACSWVRELARRTALSRVEAQSFCTAVAEALEHVFQRAYAGCPGLPILLTACNGAAGVSLSIRDYGRKPVPTTAYAPRRNPLPEGAYRLWRLYGLVDEVRLDPTPREGSVLTLVKKAEGRS